MTPSTTPTAEQRHRALWASAFLGAAAILSVGGFFSVGAGLISEYLGVRLASAALLLAWAGCLLSGLIFLWRAVLGSGALAIVTAALFSAAIVLGLVGLVPLFGLGSGTLALLLLPSIVLFVGAAICAARFLSAQPLTTSRPPTRAPVPTAIIPSFVIGMLALVALGTWEVLVLTPTELAPGYTTGEIYDALAPADRFSGVLSALVWAIFWIAVTAAAAVLAPILARRRAVSARGLVGMLLLIASATLFFHFWAGFSMAMSVSDTLPPGIGGISDLGWALTFLGQGVGVAGVFALLAPRLEPPHPVAAPV